jgi:hypothetical protein
MGQDRDKWLGFADTVMNCAFHKVEVIYGLVEELLAS